MIMVVDGDVVGVNKEIEGLIRKRLDLMVIENIVKEVVGVEFLEIDKKGRISRLTGRLWGLEMLLVKDVVEVQKEIQEFKQVVTRDLGAVIVEEKVTEVMCQKQDDKNNTSYHYVIYL